MTARESPMLDLPIRELSRLMRQGDLSARALTEHALRKQQETASAGIFLSFQADALEQADALDRLGPPTHPRQRLLHGIPISIKDNFQVRGQRMSCGSTFYAQHSVPARRDAAFVAKWRSLGAIFLGQTHLNEFAYGLTGENIAFGDMAQPKHPDCLTGGSSSGAAASVQAGIACVGLGTDTGGSIRVPAALCGLVGLRVTRNGQLNRGVFPLAPSFDTCGWIQQHLEDVPYLYGSLSGRSAATAPLRIGLLAGKWLEVCEPAILAELMPLQQELRRRGFQVTSETVDSFLETAEIFSHLQASEAAKVHAAYLLNPACHYEPAVRDRLTMGANLPNAKKRVYLKKYRQHLVYLDSLWARFDLLLAPATPVLRLLKGQDQSAARPRLLQLTTPFSLGGLPVLTFPWGQTTPSVGWQVAAAPHCEDQLVQFAEIFSRPPG